MSFLQSIYPGDDIASFAVRVLAEITLVTVVALAFGRLAARKNPALRHGVYICALLCVLAAPVSTLVLERLGWSTFQISLEQDRQPVRYAAPIPSRTMAVAETLPKQPFWTVGRARTTASLIILAWAAGIVVLLSRLVGGVRKVTRLRRSARVIDHPKLEAALARLNDIDRFPPVPIRFSHKLHSPVVVGPFRTTVILPEKLLEQLDEKQLQCVLAHELTHVRQRDPLVGLIQRIVEAGYWPHPLVHVLNQDLVRAREEVCDNVALHGTTAPQYADTLLTVALGLRPNHATIAGTIGLMTRPWRLEERVKGLLDPHRRLTTTMNTRHLAFMAISLAAGTALIGGARIVAAPNPPHIQDTIELFAHYNPKTNAVEVTTKTIKKSQTKAVKPVKLTVKRSQPKSGAVSYYSVSPVTVTTVGKSSDMPVVVDLRGSVQMDEIKPELVGKTLKVKTIAGAGNDSVSFVTTDTVGDKASRVQFTTADGSIRDVAVFTGTPQLIQTSTISDTKPETVGVTVLSTTGTLQSVPAITVSPNSKLTQTVTIVNGNTSQQAVVVGGGENQTITSGSPFTIQKSKDLTVNVYQAGKTENPTAFSYKVQGSADPFQSKAKTYIYRTESSDPTVTFVKPLPVKQTTVYIYGSDIKIVGDNIKVVYEKAQVSSKKTVKTVIKPKTKGR